jgi:hypothetical protein
MAPPIKKTKIGEDVTAKILGRVQIDTKKNTSETLILQRYFEIIPSVNRTAVIKTIRNKTNIYDTNIFARRIRGFEEFRRWVHEVQTGRE